MSKLERTEADTLRDLHAKLLRNIDHAHTCVHHMTTAPISISYEALGLDLKDAMDAALDVSKMLKAKGL